MLANNLSTWFPMAYNVTIHIHILHSCMDDIDHHIGIVTIQYMILLKCSCTNSTHSQAYMVNPPTIIIFNLLLIIIITNNINVLFLSTLWKVFFHPIYPFTPSTQVSKLYPLRIVRIIGIYKRNSWW